MMDQVLLGLQGVELLVYIDDVIVYSQNLEEHRTKLERLFNRLVAANLALQPEKCHFLKTEVVFLGHVCSK